MTAVMAAVSAWVPERVTSSRYGRSTALTSESAGERWRAVRELAGDESLRNVNVLEFARSKWERDDETFASRRECEDRCAELNEATS